jgi:hypothetical protein
LTTLLGLLVGGGLGWFSVDPVVRGPQGEQLGVSLLGVVLSAAAGALGGAVAGAVVGAVILVIRAKWRAGPPVSPGPRS